MCAFRQYTHQLASSQCSWVLCPTDWCICMHTYLSECPFVPVSIKIAPLALAVDLWADRTGLGALSRRMGNSHSALRVQDFLPCLDQPDKAKTVGKGSGVPTLIQRPLSARRLSYSFPDLSPHSLSNSLVSSVLKVSLLLHLPENGLILTLTFHCWSTSLALIFFLSFPLGSFFFNPCCQAVSPQKLRCRDMCAIRNTWERGILNPAWKFHSIT